MGIQIGAKPDSGFDDPIGMLVDCHRRIERFLSILCVVVERARGRSLTEEERQAVEAALLYFRVGGQRHNADEEESLFPRLRAVSTGEGFHELGGLENEHRQANKWHEEADGLYRSWMDAGRLSTEDEERIVNATRQLQRLYDGHIQLEERVVFPRAAEVLDRPSIAAMGEEFRARRP